MFNQIASKETQETTKLALENNGFTVIMVNTAAEAKTKALELLPKGAEVFTFSSVTLKQLGITEEIDQSGNYDSVKAKLNSLNRETQKTEMRKLGAAPNHAIGSVHAITEDGKVFIASNTGSQLPADAYGAGQVIWIVGAQKIVKDEAEAKQRIYEYILPQESERLNKAHNLTIGSFVSKLLIFYREIQAGRITIILTNEVLGF